MSGDGDDPKLTAKVKPILEQLVNLVEAAPLTPEAKATMALRMAAYCLGFAFAAFKDAHGGGTIDARTFVEKLVTRLEQQDAGKQ